MVIFIRKQITLMENILKKFADFTTAFMEVILLPVDIIENILNGRA